MQKSVAVVLKGYPRLSETFIAEELHALERAGVAVAIFSLRRPTDSHTHPVHRAIRARAAYLPEYLHREPLRVLRAWLRMRRRPRYRDALRMWRRDLRRDFTRNRVRRFGQALVLAAELPEDSGLLYAHFMHTPASVARYAAVLAQLPWACSAHAKDIWTLPEWEKREKLADCVWLTTCTRANFEHLRELAGEHEHERARVALNYHGIDLARIDAQPRHSSRDGADAAQPVRILSVGRAVAKKGYFGLLDALAELPRDLHWEMTHIGGGPLLGECKRRANALGIGEKVRWLGAQPRREVFAQYGAADFFALHCVVAEDGDRDGLPNVLVEAQSHGLAVVSTRVSGIPELVEDGVTGILVEPHAGRALGAALQKLAADPALRRKLGEAGREVVRARFGMNENFAGLHQLIRAALAPSARPQ